MAERDAKPPPGPADEGNGDDLTDEDDRSTPTPIDPYRCESWIKTYVRESARDLLLSWQARAVRDEFRRKCDAAGVIETTEGIAGLTVVLRHFPVDLLANAIRELEQAGVLEELDDPPGYIDPRHFEAQLKREKAGALIQAEYRARKRADAVLKKSGRLPESVRKPNADVRNPDRKARKPDRMSTIRSEEIRSDKKRRDQKAESAADAGAVVLHQGVVAVFDQRYREASGGSKPTWDAKTIKIVKTLVGKHGCQEVIDRIQRLFAGWLPWFSGVPDVKTLAAHFDKLVGPKPKPSRAPTSTGQIYASRGEVADGEVKL